MNEVKIETFLNERYSNSALYILFRSIGSYIDGQKPSTRKVIYTIREQNITDELKVSVLQGKVSSFTQYLHGEGSLQGAICTMAQSYTGSNNMNLLSPEGNFGTRMLPAPSAARYIFTKKTENFDKIFKKDDDKILIEQSFEGSKIEPKFYVPTVPLILINGSEGIGVGYSQYILPRNPENIISLLNSILQNKKVNKDLLMPWFKGFRGTVERSEDKNSYFTTGLVKYKNTTTIEIDEIPIGYNLKSYIKVLNTLEDKGIIRSYDDLTEKDVFKFKVSVPRDFSKKYPNEEDLIKVFKLRTKMTENLTCEDENNSIIIFDDPFELLNKYIEIKKKFLVERKKILIKLINEQIKHISNIVRFCKAVIDETLILRNVEKQKIILSLEEMEFDKEKHSFDYLLNIPISSITKEKYEELEKKKNYLIQELEKLKEKSIESLWLEDLKEFKIK